MIHHPFTVVSLDLTRTSFLSTLLRAEPALAEWLIVPSLASDAQGSRPGNYRIEPGSGRLTVISAKCRLGGFVAAACCTLQAAYQRLGEYDPGAALWRSTGRVTTTSPGRHRMSLCEKDDDDVRYHSLPDRKVKLATFSTTYRSWRNMSSRDSDYGCPQAWTRQTRTDPWIEVVRRDLQISTSP